MDATLTQSPNYRSSIKIGQLCTVYGSTSAPLISAIVKFLFATDHFADRGESQTAALNVIVPGDL
jgi:hypothetical protein